MPNAPYIPLTAIDCTIPALLIDRNAPLDVLHANAAARDLEHADQVDLKHLATTAMLLLRDGCDLLDVLGWRLRPA